MLATNIGQMMRHLPRASRTCAGCFSRNGLAMLSTSVLYTCFGFGALQRAGSITSRGAGMNSISEILVGRQQGPSSGPFSDPSDSHQRLERVSARDLTWLPIGKCDRRNSTRRSLESRSRQGEALLRKWQGICQSHSVGQIVPKPAKPECSHV